MVSPISVRLAETIIQFLEPEIILLLGPTICFGKIYFNEVFLIAKQDDLTEILE